MPASDRDPLYDPVTDYARQVVSGGILTGKWVRLACQRHLSDLQRDDLYWDLPAALHHINFFEQVLRLPFKDEPYLRPFKLLPHQMFKQGSIFGWKKRGDRSLPIQYVKRWDRVAHKWLPGRPNHERSTLPRRFWYVYDEEAKGSGKSPVGAGTALYMGCADDEPKAECFFAAGKKEQARIAFEHAVILMLNSPELSARFEMSGSIKQCYQLTFMHPQRAVEGRLVGSWLKPISAEEKTQSGPMPHFVFFDELHEIDRPTVVDMLRKAIGKNRTQPIVYEGTNSGVDRNSLCYQHRQQAERMLDGTLPNDALFAYICGLDEGSGNAEECICGKSSSWDRRVTCPCCGDIPDEVDGKPQDEMEYLLQHAELWVKANPGIDRGLPSYEYVRQQIKDAIGLPSQRNLVLRLHFCVWTDAVTVWIPDEVWMDNADLSLDARVDHSKFGRITKLEAELIGRRGYFGFDLAQSNDWTALFGVFPDDAGAEDPNEQVYSLLEWYFIDRETFDQRCKKDKMLQVWVDERDDIIVTPGARFDPTVIRAHILDKIVPRYVLEATAYDRTFAHQIVTSLESDGLKMVEWAPTMQWMGAPIAEIERRVKGRLFRHRGHPVTRWMMRNVQVLQDPSGLKMIDKKRSVEKVDGPVALAFALGWCMRANTGEKKSVYETRGPRFLKLR